ncbi:uncharacterized protein LOC124117162 isoform X2 [Haliotis rufescens]|nr:uncharacterized protein LOC124117162 isoform X2 [Haliotis rufescens]
MQRKQIIETLPENDQREVSPLLVHCDINPGCRVSLAYGQDCSSEMNLAICASSLTGYSGDPEALGEFCSTAAATETCVARVLDECPNLRSSNTAQYITMMQNQISSLCPSTNGDATAEDDCQPGYMGRLMTCAAPLPSLDMNPNSANYQQSCREGLAAVDCLEGVFNSCSSKPEIQQMMASMDTATLRRMLGSC